MAGLLVGRPKKSAIRSTVARPAIGLDLCVARHANRFLTAKVSGGMLRNLILCFCNWSIVWCHPSCENPVWRFWAVARWCATRIEWRNEWKNERDAKSQQESEWETANTLAIGLFFWHAHTTLVCWERERESQLVNEWMNEDREWWWGKREDTRVQRIYHLRKKATINHPQSHGNISDCDCVCVALCLCVACVSLCWMLREPRSNKLNHQAIVVPHHQPSKRTVCSGSRGSFLFYILHSPASTVPCVALIWGAFLLPSSSFIVIVNELYPISSIRLEHSRW
jgi:hypothetical protein